VKARVYVPLNLSVVRIKSRVSEDYPAEWVFAASYLATYCAPRGNVVAWCREGPVDGGFSSPIQRQERRFKTDPNRVNKLWPSWWWRTKKRRKRS